MYKEALIPLIVLAASIAFLDPFMVLMPSMLVYTILGMLLAAFVAYALLIFREQAADEREEAHRAFAGRISYIVGTGILVFGIIYQVLVLHSVDPLLVLALAGMTVAKYVSLHFVRTHN